MTNKKFIKSNIISIMNIKSLVLISVLIAVMVFNAGCIDNVTETLPGKDTDSPDKDTDEPQKGDDETPYINETKREFKCQPMEETVAMGENIDMEVFFKVKGEVKGKCEIYEKVVKDNTGLGLEGKDMTCKIPMGAITGSSPLTDNIKDYCNGTLADAIKELTKEVKEK